MKVSKTGYKKNSKDKNQPSLLIPSNRITMKDVEFPVLGTDNYGNQQMMYPGQEYSFPGNYVYEKPMKNWLNKYADGGPGKPKTVRIDFGEGSPYGKGIQDVEIDSPQYKAIYPNLMAKGIDPSTGGELYFGTPMEEIVITAKGNPKKSKQTTSKTSSPPASFSKPLLGYPYPLDAYQKKQATDQEIADYKAYMSGNKANKNYFYETHELVKNSDGTQSWKVKDDVNYNEAIKGTPLGQFIYNQAVTDANNNFNYTDQFGNIYAGRSGLEMGYSPYNIWATPTSGISLYDEFDNILNQIEMVPGVYPTIYFLGANNPIKQGEPSLWDMAKVQQGPFGFNESILGSGLADQGYSALGISDSFSSLDKLKGKYKETFGYGDDLLRVVDPTDYNVMGALQLTPEIVEYLKNLERDLPNHKFNSANQDKLLKALEDERTIKEYLLKQAGIDPALGMQSLMHYNYTPLDVYSEINNPSVLNWYNQIGAVKNKFQDISYDKYTNDPEYKRLLDQFLDENKVVRKTGGSTKWLDRYDNGGPGKPKTIKVDFGNESPYGSGIKEIDITSPEYKDIYPNLIWKTSGDEENARWTAPNLPELVYSESLDEYGKRIKKYTDDLMSNYDKSYSGWGYDPKVVRSNLLVRARNQVAQEILNNVGGDISKLNEREKGIISRSEFASRLGSNIWENTKEGWNALSNWSDSVNITEPDTWTPPPLESLKALSPLFYPINAITAAKNEIVRGSNGEFAEALKGNYSAPLTVSTDYAYGNLSPDAANIISHTLPIVIDPVMYIDPFAALGNVTKVPLGLLNRGLKNLRAPRLGKYNPWGFKPQEGMMYRGLGEEGFKDAVQTGVFRPKQLGYAPNRSFAEKITSPKQFGSTFYTPAESFGTIRNYGPSYVAEVPFAGNQFARRYGRKNWSWSTPRQIPINEGRILKEHWLWGYKPVNISEYLSQPTSTLSQPTRNTGSLLSGSRSGYEGINDLRNYTGDIAEGDIISNANVANYDFMTSPANIQKRAAFRSGPDPVNFGAPQIYGSLDPELQTAYEAARNRVLQEKHLYTDPKDIEFALNVERSPSYYEYMKASGKNPDALSGQFSQGLDMGFVNEMNQGPLSTWLSALHEGNHGYLAKTGVMPQEKLLIDRAYKDIVYPSLQGLSENEKMMEGFAVQRELRALLGDKTGTKIFTMSDAPAIRKALETLKVTGHPYLSNLDNTNMRALVQALNKIGLASVTGVGLGYGLGYGFSGNDNTIHKLGGSTGKLDRYDTGGPKPKGVHTTKKLNSALTIGYTLEPNTIYLYTGDQWRALTGDDYNRFKENNPTVISDMETFNKSWKVEPRKQETRIEKQEAKRPNPKTSVVKNDKPAGTAWPVNSKEENDFINTYVYANRKPAPKETLFEKLMRQMDLKKRLNLTWAEDPSLMPSLSIEQEKRRKINSKFGDEQYPLFKDIYINYQKEQDRLRAEENRKNSELGFFDKLINAYRTHRGIRENVDNNIRNAVVNSEWIPEWVPGIGGMSPSGAYDAIKNRFIGAMASEDPEAIADANVDQGLKIQTSEDGKVKSRTEFGFHPNPDPNTGNWKLKDKDSKVPTDSLAKFTYTFDNDKGGKYVVSHKEKEMENGAQRRFDDVYAVSHFLRDADILPGQKFVPQYLETHGSQLPNQAYDQGKYISYSKVNSDPEKYWMLSKPGANENERYIKYKKKKDITAEDRKEWSVDLPTNGQHRFSDIDWDGNGVSTGYLSRSYWLPLKDNAKNIQSWTDPKHTRIPYKDKEAFSRFSGATVTYIFKDPTTGENISRDISGSINEIKKVGVNIIKTYGVKPEDLEFVYHDTGSYSAKPAAYPGNILNHRQWAGFNSLNKGYSGAALMVPSKKYGGTAEYQDSGSKEMPLGLPLKEQNPYLVPEHYKPMANGYILQDPTRAQLLNTGATEYKYSYDLDGKEVQVPSIVGGQYIGDQAIDRYMLTGEQFKPMADPSSYSKFYDDMYRLGLMQPEYKKGGVKTSAEGYYDYINGYKGVSLSKGGPSKKGWLEKYK